MSKSILYELVTHPAYPGALLRIVEVSGTRATAEIRPNKLTREVTKVNDRIERFQLSDQDRT